MLAMVYYHKLLKPKRLRESLRISPPPQVSVSSQCASGRCLLMPLSNPARGNLRQPSAISPFSARAHAAIRVAHAHTSDRIGPHRNASDRIGSHRIASDCIGSHLRFQHSQLAFPGRHRAARALLQPSELRFGFRDPSCAELRPRSLGA